MLQPVIAIITDFGDRDGYTGVLKGVILERCREAILVDVAHGVSPQDIHHGSWVLDQAFNAFPQGAFFLCVVDPAVGDPTQRKLVVYFEGLQKGMVLPDNGLATRILQRIPKARCFAIENCQLFREMTDPSQTFHGRDIYAPVAAHLAKAYTESRLETFLPSLGPEITMESLRKLEIHPPRRINDMAIEGQIDIVDTYGNLITNIPSAWFSCQPGALIALESSGKLHTLNFATHYQQAFSEVVSALYLIQGSHGLLEISQYRASAAQALGLGSGMRVTLKRL